MKKVNLLVVFVALGVLAWVIPAQTARAANAPSVVTAQQDEPAEPAEPAAEETETQSSQMFMGQIVQHEGKYVLQGEGDRIYQLDNQETAKGFEGKHVKVSGTLDEQSSTIHVTDIEEAEAQE